MKSNADYRIFVVLLVLFGLGFAAQAQTLRIWNGAGADSLASTPANWVGGAAPVGGDSVQFDGTSLKACDWDLNIGLLNWTQTAAYSGAVTI